MSYFCMSFCMRSIRISYVICMREPFIWLNLCGQMNEPYKNSLGCNACHTGDYSLNQCLRYSYCASSTAACAAASRAIGTLNGEQDA